MMVFNDSYNWPLTVSLTGLAAQPILMEQGMKIGGTGMAVDLCCCISSPRNTSLIFITDEYTAMTISILLFKIKTKFRPSDVKVPDVPGMVTSFKVKDKPMFIEPTLFENTDHYVRIIGYDKPMNFKLDIQPEKKNKTSAPSSSDKESRK